MQPIDPLSLHMSAISPHTVSFHVYTSYVSYEDSTTAFFLNPATTNTSLPTFPEPVRACCSYVTTSVMPAADKKLYNDHFCDLQDRMACQNETRIRQAFPTSSAFIKYCERHRRAPVIAEG